MRCDFDQVPGAPIDSEFISLDAAKDQDQRRRAMQRRHGVTSDFLASYCQEASLPKSEYGDIRRAMALSSYQEENPPCSDDDIRRAIALSMQQERPEDDELRRGAEDDELRRVLALSLAASAREATEAAGRQAEARQREALDFHSAIAESRRLEFHYPS